MKGDKARGETGEKGKRKECREGEWGRWKRRRGELRWRREETQ